MTESVSELLAARFGDAPDVPADLDADPVLASIAAHRSYRRFEPRPVPDAVLDTVLACALAAPSKSDLQQACVVRVRDAALHREIAGLIPSMPWVADAPVLLVFCGDNRRIRRICELRGRPFANDHLDSFFNASVDAALVLMNLVRAAEAAGLGCCPLSVVRNHAARVSALLELPDHVFPVAGLVAGYPGETRRVVPRIGLEATVHVDRYRDDDLEGALRRYDERRDAVLPIRREAQREPERFGHADFYGWSEDKARQVAVRERGDFGAFVRERGFNLE